MNCRKCGNILNEGDMICRICGEPVQAMNQPMNSGVPGGAMPTPQPTPVPTPTPGVAPQVQQPVMTPTPSQPVITPEMANSGMGMGQTIAPGQPQPMNMMNQPMMQQPVNSGANMGAPKDNKTFKILIGVLLVVIIALGGFVAVKFIGGDKTETKETDKKEKEPTKTEKEPTKTEKEPTKTEKEPEESEDPGNDPVVSEGNYFEYAGYKFTIPNDVKYQKSEGTLMVSDGQTYTVAISVDKSVSFDLVKGSPDAVAEAIAAEGIVTKNYEFKTIDGVEYYVLNIEADSQKGVFYYAKLDDYSCVMGMVVLNDTSALDKALKVSSKIIKTGTTTSSFAPGNSTTPNYKVTDEMKNIFKEGIKDSSTGE